MKPGVHRGLTRGTGRGPIWFGSGSSLGGGPSGLSLHLISTLRKLTVLLSPTLPFSPTPPPTPPKPLLPASRKHAWPPPRVDSMVAGARGCWKRAGLQGLVCLGNGSRKNPKEPAGGSLGGPGGRGRKGQTGRWGERSGCAQMEVLQGTPPPSYRAHKVRGRHWVPPRQPSQQQTRGRDGFSAPCLGPPHKITHGNLSVTKVLNFEARSCSHGLGWQDHRLDYLGDPRASHGQAPRSHPQREDLSGMVRSLPKARSGRQTLPR